MFKQGKEYARWRQLTMRGSRTLIRCGRAGDEGDRDTLVCPCTLLCQDRLSCRVYLAVSCSRAG